MSIIVSKAFLSKFQDCPEGASILDTDPQPVPVPVNTSLPVISGALTIGSTLTTTNGTWTSTEPIIYTYQWLRNGVPVAGATSRTYVIIGVDVGFSISVVVAATNAGGSTQATAVPVGPIGGLLNSDLPVVSGGLAVGSTLTTTNGGWVGTLPITFAYSWQRNGVDIPGATSNTYTLVHADAGLPITSRVIATNITGSVSAYSARMGPVSELVVDITPPVISGLVVVGSTLTTTDGTWAGTPAPTFTYQWGRNGVPVSGATASTYVLVAADIGTMITATVTGTNSAGSASAISNSLGPIVASATLQLSNSLISKSVAIGSTVGAFSVLNGSGSYTYTLTSNPLGLFAVSGSNLNTAMALNGGFYSITVQASSGFPLPPSASFIIAVASISLSGATIPQDATIGTTIGTLGVGNGTGSYTYSLTSSPSGQFVISGANLNVATVLAPGSYPITVQATGGVPSPVSETLMLTVTVVIPSVVVLEGTWFNGLPYPGIEVAANDVGSMSYWFNGLPVPAMKD